MKKLLASLLSVALCMSSAHAVPQVLNFQGRLSESGVFANGNRQIIFRIFPSQIGGTALFTETRSIAVSSGIFNAVIGEETAGGIPVAVFDGNDRYVEVQIGTTVLPRQKMASVAHAFYSERAKSLVDGLTAQFNNISVASITANTIAVTTVTAVWGRFTEGIVAGKGTIYVDGNGTLMLGLPNAVTLTQKTGQNIAQIRTAADGSQHLPAATGNTPLTINTGASGTLSINPFSSGGISIGNAATDATGISINAGLGAITTPSNIILSGLAPGLSSTLGPLTLNSAGNITLNPTTGARLDVESAAQFGAGSTKSTFSSLGDLTLAANASLNLAGPSGHIATGSSITASAFFGDGSGLTNIFSTDPTKVLKTGDSMTGTLNMSNASINLNGAAGNLVSQASVTASGFFGDGSGLTGIFASQVAAANVTPGTFVTGVGLPAPGVLAGNLGNDVIASSIAISAITDVQVAPSANIAQSKIANLPADLAAKVSKTGDTMTGSLNMSNAAINLTGPTGEVVGQSSITASAFFGDGSNLSGITASQVAAANVTPGIFVAGVNLPAASVLAGNLGSSVIASSIALSAISDEQVAPGANIDQAKISNLPADLAAKVSKTGDTMTGTLNMGNVAINLAGAAGNLVGQSSVTASAFFGDGSNLTGVSASQVAAVNVTPGTFVSGVNLPAAGVLAGNLGGGVVASSVAISAVTDNQVAASANIAQSKIANLPADLASKVSKTGDSMTGSLTMTNSTIFLTGPAGDLLGQSSVTASAFFGDGSNLTGVAASQVSAANVTPGTFSPGVNIPAAGVLAGSLGSNVIASSITLSAVSDDQVAVGANISQAKISNLTSDLAAKVSKAGDTMTGALNMSNVAINLFGAAGDLIGQSSVTASAFFGDGSNLTGVSASQVAAANVTPGTFVTGVNLPAAGVLPGSLSNGVIASSISISAVSDDQVAAGANIAQSKIANLPADLAAKVSKAGDTMTGSLNMSNAAINLTGPAGYLISQSSMTASAFFGDGSGLTNVMAADSTKVSKAGDTMTGALNMSNVAVNLTGPSGNLIGQSSVTASAFFGDGSNLTGVTATQIAAAGVMPGSLGSAVIVSSIAVSAIGDDQVTPGANIAQSKIANLPADLASKVSKAGDIMTGTLTMSNAAISLSGPAGALVGQSSVTASAFFGDGSNLTGISGPWTKIGPVVALANPTDNVVVQSTLTVQGTEFSIGGSLLSVNNGNVGVGTASPGAPLDVAGTARMTGFALPPGAASGLVLTSDSSGNGTWQPAPTGGGGGSIPTNMQVFTASGSFTVPAGVTRIMVEVWGGGGGGGSSNNLGLGGGGGGGAGGYGRQFFTVTPGAVLTATIGAGGTAANFSAGGTGGTTSFGGLISATGGTGGAAAQSLGGGAAGGTGGTSAATFNISGGSGGGSGTGSSGATANAIASGAMGGSAANGGAGGGGGRAVFSFNPSVAAGRPGTAPGGGGGGGAGFDTNAGGVGAAGRVLVTW